MTELDRDVVTGQAGAGCKPIVTGPADLLEAEAVSRLVHIAPDRFEPVALYNVAEAIAVRPERQLVVLCRSAAASLAQAMAAGTAPSAALSRWMTQASEVLQLFRRQRQRSLLIDIDALERGLPAYLDRLDVSVGKDALPAADAPHDPLFFQVAAFAVQQDRRARSLDEELEASALDLVDGSVRQLPDPDAAFGHLAKVKGALSEEEERVLLEQLGQAQRECEAHYAARTDLETRLAAALGEAEESHRRTAAARSENDLTIQQLAVLQQELETRSAAHEKAQAKLAKLETAVSEKNKKLAGLSQRKKDTEAKLLRAEAHLAARDQAVDALSKEVADLKRERSSLRQSASEAEKTHAALAEKVAGLSAERVQLAQELNATQATIREIYASRSYRLMTPLRKIRGASGRKGPQGD